MTIRIWSLAIIILILGASLTEAQAPLIFKGRLAFSHDGNENDRDDWGASAFEWGICWAFGVQSKVVHFQYSDFIDASAGSTGDKQMIESATGGPKHFNGFNANIIFSCLTQREKAIANFKLQAEKSGPGDTLAFICAGPMEMPWRCLNAVTPEKRKFIKVIQHGLWNMGKVSGSSMTHSWKSCLASFPEVKFVKIQDQNANLGGGSKWAFLLSMPKVCNLDPSAWVWMESRDQTRGDVSDCGMTWYTLTGNQTAQESDFEKRFKNPICEASTALTPLTRALSGSTAINQAGRELFYSISGRTGYGSQSAAHTEATVLHILKNGRTAVTRSSHSTPR